MLYSFLLVLEWVPLSYVLEAIAFSHPHAITNESILACQTKARADKTSRLYIHALFLDWNYDEVVLSGIWVRFIKTERIHSYNNERIWAIPSEKCENNLLRSFKFVMSLSLIFIRLMVALQRHSRLAKVQRYPSSGRYEGKVVLPQLASTPSHRFDKW